MDGWVNIVRDQTTFCGFLPNETATLALARAFAQIATPGLVCFLYGELGTGKTTFVRGFLRQLGITGTIKSPTYTLVETYSINELTVHHFDLYRFTDEEEWEDAGFNEYITSGALNLIEWPERAANILPSPDIVLRLELAEEGRQYLLSAPTKSGQSCLNRLSTIRGASF